MSQEKVARYKEEKANRKAIMKKQKRARYFRNTVSTIVLVAVVGWVGYSAVDFYLENRPRTAVEVDYAAVQEYETGLNAEQKTE